MTFRPEPFVVDIADDVLADLRDRIRSTRWPRDLDDAAGTSEWVHARSDPSACAMSRVNPTRSGDAGATPRP
jgi:hypothetical protein